MVIFNVFVRWDKGHNRPFRIPESEVYIELVPINGNDQYMIKGNDNRIIMGIENAQENTFFGEGH